MRDYVAELNSRVLFQAPLKAVWETQRAFINRLIVFTIRCTSSSWSKQRESVRGKKKRKKPLRLRVSPIDMRNFFSFSFVGNEIALNSGLRVTFGNEAEYCLSSFQTERISLYQSIMSFGLLKFAFWVKEGEIFDIVKPWSILTLPEVRVLRVQVTILGT